MLKTEACKTFVSVSPMFRKLKSQALSILNMKKYADFITSSFFKNLINGTEIEMESIIVDSID